MNLQSLAYPSPYIADKTIIMQIQARSVFGAKQKNTILPLIKKGKPISAHATFMQS